MTLNDIELAFTNYEGELGMIEFAFAMCQRQREEDAKIVERFAWGALSNVAKAIREAKT